MQNNTGKWLLSSAVALMVWQAAASFIGEALFLPSPISVIMKLGTMMTDPSFYSAVGQSTLRIVLGFLLAVIIGVSLAGVALRSELGGWLIQPYISAMKSTPVVSFIVLCLLWLKDAGLTVFVVFLVNLPIIYVNALKGMRSASSDLIETAKVYHMPFLRRLRYIYFPAMQPSFLSAISLSAGVSWKSGVAAEVLSLPAGTIGNRLWEAKIYLETSELFAWTLVILVMSMMFERISSFLFESLFRRLER